MAEPSPIHPDDAAFDSLLGTLPETEKEGLFKMSTPSKSKPFNHSTMPDPEMVGASEYHAIYDVLETAEDADHARGILEEFEHHVREIRKMVGLTHAELAGRIATAFPNATSILKGMVEEAGHTANKAGIANQIDFLMHNGHSEHDIVEKLKELSPTLEL